MSKSKARMIIEAKQATIECNPLKKDGKKCAAIFMDEVEEVLKEFDKLETLYKKYISRDVDNAKKS